MNISGISPASTQRNPSLEHKLSESWGISEWIGSGPQPLNSWRFSTILRSEIDEVFSMRNQSRQNAPLDFDNLEKIRRGVKNGSSIPAIVVFPVGDSGTYVIADGNHRYKASEEYGKMNAYIVNTDKEAIRNSITVMSNMDNGLPLSLQNRIGHAVNSVNGGMSQDKAAELWGVKENQIRQELSVRRFQQIIQPQVPGSGNLGEDAKKSLMDAFGVLPISNTLRLTRLAVKNEGVSPKIVKDYCGEYKNCAKIPEGSSKQKHLLENMETEILSRVKIDTAGGAIKGCRIRPKKAGFDKDECIKMITRLSAYMTKLTGDIPLADDEFAKMKRLGELLLSTAKKRVGKPSIYTSI